MTDTIRWPMIQAKWFTPLKRNERSIRVIVIHDMEFPERITAAEDVAAYFSNPRDDRGNPVKASAHICVDNNSIVQCVYDSDVAFAAPGANHDGIQIELAGYGKQSRDNWLDVYSVGVLSFAADAVSQYAIKYGIPIRQLTDKQLADGKSKGIIGHYQASRVFKKSDHTDPGENFPWDVFLTMCEQFKTDRRAA